MAARILNLRPKASQMHAGLTYDDADNETLNLNFLLGLLRKTT